jgi:hypothetical protein
LPGFFFPLLAFFSEDESVDELLLVSVLLESVFEDESEELLLLESVLASPSDFAPPELP